MVEHIGNRVGQQLGNYRLLRLLGRGGFASVYLGEHVYLKSLAALKMLHTVLKDEAAADFVKEAQTLARLSHPHIVRVLDFSLESSIPFLVMEYAPNGTLRQRHPIGTRLLPNTIVSYVKQVASALQHAHDQCLIHRDVKPENMLLSLHDKVLLSDFGLALLAPDTLSLSRQGILQQIAGTAAYLAPEQLQGKPGIASDQYTLGIVVYEWLCGKHPFSGSPIEIATQHLLVPPPPLRKLLPDLCPAIEEVVLQTLVKDPKLRFARVLDFADALEHACQPTRITSSMYCKEVPESASGSTSSHSILSSEPLWKVPTTLTRLIGREQDVAAICTLLERPEVRSLTLLGTGGIGKTRLSLQVATEMRKHFTHGVCFVPLAAISDPTLVVASIAEMLGVREVSEQPLFEQVQMYLREKQLLLILDNFEQVVRAVSQVEELLAACPHLKVIVTSRAALHMQGEQEYPVSPLRLPPLKQLPQGEALAQYAAVALFLERARAVVPTFQMTLANADAVAEICVHLDGLPLAIELAAARVKLLPPRILLARLTQRFQVLTGGARTLPVRQQTLHNTLQWSYDLLDAEEQRLFRRFAVFRGGSTLEAVEAVWSVDHATESGALSALDAVASLLDKSLLLGIEHEREEPRFIMLETVREFGLERLREMGKAEVSQRAHAEYYVSWAEQAESHLKGAQQLSWLGRLKQEQENLRAALGWLIEQEEAVLALRLCAILWQFWHIRGYWSEGQRWLEAALGLPGAERPTAARARVLCGAGTLASRLGEVVAAHSWLEESSALYQELGEQQGLAEALGRLGWSLYQQSDLPAARTLLEESVRLAQAVGDQSTLANTLLTLGMFLHYQGEATGAQHLLEESEALSRKLGDTHALASTLANVGRTALEQGNVTHTIARAQESLALARELDNRRVIAEALYLLASVAELQGAYAQAVELSEQCLELAQEIGDKQRSAYALYLLGYIALRQGEKTQAATQAQASLTRFRELGLKADIAIALTALGEISWAQGDLAQAQSRFHEGLMLSKEAGRKLAIGWSIIGLARIAAAEGQLLRAVCLFAAAEPWFDPNVNMEPIRTADYQRTKESMLAQLGKQVFLATWTKGRSMTLEHILATTEPATTHEPLPATKSLPPAISLDELTAREVEVLRLVAQGWTDAQIAKHLVISPRTVNAHLTSIYRKIQVSSRSAATRYAMEHHLA